MELETSFKGKEDVFRMCKDHIFHHYKFLDYLYVSDDNEKALIEKLQK